MSQRRILTTGLIVISQIISSCSHKPSMTSNAAAPNANHEEMRTPNSEANSEESPWSTWSSRKTTFGTLLALKEVRDNMFRMGLHDPHVNYSGYDPVSCTDADKYFRSADGTCNDLGNPHVGAANVAFGRNVNPIFIDKNAAEKLMTPNPALVSKEFFTRDEFKPVPFLNMLAAVWIQFMNHDWLTHGRNKEENPHRVRVEDGPDKVVEQTKDNPTNRNQYDQKFGKVSLNEVTHWWDGSQIYGSSQKDQNLIRSGKAEVRSGTEGLLLTEQFKSGKELLPKAANFNPRDNKQNQGYEVTGFRDNWWLGLSMLHTLFVKEHNAIAKELLKKHVTRDHSGNRWIWENGSERVYLDDRQLDEKIFQTARLINAAVMAKIHTVEWTPAILPNPTLRTAMYINWYGGINPQTLFNGQGPLSRAVRHVSNRADWFKITQTGYLIGGIVGDKTNNHGTPYSITEEFTSVYRLHSLLPEKLHIKTLQQKDLVKPISFADTRNDRSYALMEKYDLKDLYYSFGTQNPGQLVLNNYPKFMQNLEIPGHGTMDLGMVDIIRDRERGPCPRFS